MRVHGRVMIVPPYPQLHNYTTPRPVTEMRVDASSQHQNPRDSCSYAVASPIHSSAITPALRNRYQRRSTCHANVRRPAHAGGVAVPSLEQRHARVRGNTPAVRFSTLSPLRNRPRLHRQA